MKKLLKEQFNTENFEFVVCMLGGTNYILRNTKTRIYREDIDKLLENTTELYYTNTMPPKDGYDYSTKPEGDDIIPVHFSGEKRTCYVSLKNAFIYDCDIDTTSEKLHDLPSYISLILNTTH